MDLINTNVEIAHKPFGTIRNKETEEGDKQTKQYSKTIYINRVPLFVTSMNNGTRINIRCCALKVFQGHNVFGTNNMKTLWTRLIVEVLRQLGIKPSKDQIRNWMRGEFDIEEIHITHRFPVSHYSMVRKIISHIRRYTSEALAPSPLPKGVGVTLRAPHGKAKWMFYDKHQEFMDKRTKEHKYLYEVLGDTADTTEQLLSRLASQSIRAELKLGRKYLKDEGLNRGKAWTSSKAIEVFTRELGLLPLGKIPAMPEMHELYAEIADPKLRSIVILWAHGEDMTDHYAPSTIRKYRKAVMDELGIDILKDRPVLETASLKLADVFDTDRMLTGFPKWARDYPAIAFR